MRRRKRPSHLKKRIPWKAIRKHNRKRKASSLETQIYEWLKEDSIAFKKEKTIGKCMHVDIFFEPKTCVELNGCYWHGCRICNRKLTEAQELAQAKDTRRYIKMRKLGFDVVVIWEHEVKEHSTRVRAQLKAIATNKDKEC